MKSRISVTMDPTTISLSIQPILSLFVILNKAERFKKSLDIFYNKNLSWVLLYLSAYRKELSFSTFLIKADHIF